MDVVVVQRQSLVSWLITPRDLLQTPPRRSLGCVSIMQTRRTHVRLRTDGRTTYHRISIVRLTDWVRRRRRRRAARHHTAAGPDPSARQAVLYSPLFLVQHTIVQRTPRPNRENTQRESSERTTECSQISTLSLSLYSTASGTKRCTASTSCVLDAHLTTNSLFDHIL